VRLVRVYLPAGARDWSQAALEAVAAIALDADVMIEGPDARLNAEFGIALGRHLRSPAGDVA
jgi:hypothetical protein